MFCINITLAVSRFAGELKGKFEYQVSDGRHVTKRMTFGILARVLALTLVNSRTLDVFPGVMQPITRHEMLATTDDRLQNRTIMYIIQSPPAYGQIVRRVNGSLTEVAR
jgi:hypothetical protein